ncbi:hypothetical protein [Synechococcus phage BUCT-ZZ01]|nr:hypothetical protein [Synechococcus phage BUCT-ZZ01]
MQLRNTFKNSNSSTINALIIEDCKLNAIILERNLQRFGLTTNWVDNREDAQKELATNHYDIIFLDHYLTDEDSGTLLNLIKRKYPNIHVIAYTGAIYTLKSVKNFLTLFPYDDVITKPYVENHLERIFLERFKVTILEQK